MTIVNGVTWNSSINLWVATNGSSASGNDFVYSVDGKNWTGIPADPNLLNTGTGNYLDSGTTILGSSIITVNWKNPDISKLCRIAPVTGYTIEATSNSFKETQFVFGNSFTFNNLPTGTYDIKIRSESYYGSSDWAYLYQIPVGNVPSAPVILDNTVIRENEQITFSFIPPAIIPGFPIQSYQYSITSPITFLSSPIAPPANNTIVVAPNPPVIDNCVPYTIKMHAINSLGVGDESNSIVVASIPGDVTFTIQLIIGTPVLPTFVNLSDGKYLLFDIDSNTNTTWNFNIIDISNSCPGEAANLKIDFLVVGGGGSGGYPVTLGTGGSGIVVIKYQFK